MQIMITYRIGDDCTKYILEFLTGADLLCSVSLTCRAWAACAHDGKLIMRMLKRDYPTLVQFSKSISPSVLLVKSEMGTLSIIVNEAYTSKTCGLCGQLNHTLVASTSLDRFAKSFPLQRDQICAEFWDRPNTY